MLMTKIGSHYTLLECLNGRAGGSWILSCQKLLALMSSIFGCDPTYLHVMLHAMNFNILIVTCVVTGQSLLE